MEKIDESSVNIKTLRISYKNICDNGSSNNDDDNVYSSFFNAYTQNI